MPEDTINRLRQLYTFHGYFVVADQIKTLVKELKSLGVNQKTLLDHLLALPPSAWIGPHQ